MSRQCEATAKSTGNRCQRDALEGRNVCGMHGGKTPRGPENPNYRHGLYSLEPSLTERLEQVQEAEAELRDLAGEIRLGRAIVAEQVQDGLPVSPEDAETLLGLLDVLTRLVKRHDAIRTGEKHVITTREVERFTTVVNETIREYFEDCETAEDLLAIIGDRLKSETEG